MAGTIPLSLTQQFDELGNVLAGGKLYLIQAGTVNTPQNGYQDSALTLLWPNPIILDAAGRLPQFFLADGSIKIRLTDRNGVEKLVADGILVTGASSGGGGGSPVDATTLFATGDLKPRYGTGVLTGFVRSNGRTIGSSTSGATERANADTQSLFEYLWNTDANLAVSTGRGASSNADWVANKNLALPDWRGRVIAGLDDMGNAAAGRLSTSYFGAVSTVLGFSGGSENTSITANNFPPNINANGINSISVHGTTDVNIDIDTVNANAGGGAVIKVVNTQGTVGVTSSGNNNVAVSLNNTTSNGLGTGAATPTRTVQPTMLATIYIKL